MRDPLGDIPWEEDISAKNVVHIPDAQVIKINIMLRYNLVTKSTLWIANFTDTHI